MMNVYEAKLIYDILKNLDSSVT